MGRMNVQEDAGYGVLPTFARFNAGKRERVLSLVKDGDFQVAIERSAQDWLPRHFTLGNMSQARPDLSHFWIFRALAH